jgi:hypothetical protein
MSTVTTTDTSAHRSTGTLALGRGRTVVEMKNLWRNRQAFGFTIAFPLMMLLLFASIFKGTIENTGVEISQVYVAGIMGSTLMSTAFVSLAIGMSIERESGMLKRLAGTPMPKASYFLGKIGMVLATVTIQVIVLMALGVAFFHIDLPATGRRGRLPRRVPARVTSTPCSASPPAAGSRLKVRPGRDEPALRRPPVHLRGVDQRQSAALVAAAHLPGVPPPLDLPGHPSGPPARLVQDGGNRWAMAAELGFGGARRLVRRRIRGVREVLPLDPGLNEPGAGDAPARG